MAESLRGVRALVVDDNATNREVLERQLGAWDMRVSAAASAAEAMAMLIEAARTGRHFDLVLLDFFMPETDGLELAAAIRARTDIKRPGVIMLSSAGPNVDAREVHKKSIDLYLAKPVRRAVLCESIDYVLNEGRASTDVFEAYEEGDNPETISLGLTVLLVEDIPINMQVAQHMLYGLGCQVLEATNGQQALEVIAEQRPDVVLMDCQMPIMDGYTATRAQRSREEKNRLPRLPIIALTANALAEDKQKCLDAGMDDFVSKPFSKAELQAALMRWSENDEEVSTVSIPDANVEPANDPEIDGDPVIDQNALQQIAELDPDNDGEFVNSIIDAFVENAEVLMLELVESVRDGEPQEVARAAHSLKSSSANVGARRFSSLCAAMEKQGRDGNLGAIEEKLEKARTEYETAIRELIASKREIAA
jgi:CheY-like chemotaxis protein/HPt (histidine-containing phosphotransfer) domain-containing protein